MTPYAPRSTPQIRTPAKVRRRRGGGFWKFLLLVVLSLSAAFGYLMIRHNESPQQTWNRVMDYARSLAQPSPAPAPEVPSPEAPPESTTVEIPAPQPEIPQPHVDPTPQTGPDPMAWLVANPERWPKEVVLLNSTEFPGVIDGRVAGKVNVPSGRKVKVVKIASDTVTAEYLGAKQAIPVDATDLKERARAAMAAPEPAKNEVASAPPATSEALAATPPPDLPQPVRESIRTGRPSAPIRFNHPGLLSTQADLQRMAAKVASGKQPWKGSWDILVRNTDGFMNATPEVEEKMRAGGRVRENFMRLARDCARAYQLALRYHGSGDKKFADKAVGILNAWAAGHLGWEGDSNVRLRAGIYGHQFACAAELLRDYPGWTRSDFKKFQDYMREHFYPLNSNFMRDRNGCPPLHYWANWTLANQASIMAIGVLCDDRKMFEEGLKYFFEGEGTETIYNAVNFIHPNGLGQWQESGRDQGHTVMGPQLMGLVCEIAWNQGIDLYSYENNRFLAGVEYISKYNLGEEVPFSTYVRVMKGPWGPQDNVMDIISPHGRGQLRPGWDLVYNHYVNRMGLGAHYTATYAERTRPEGGGFNSGGNSGGFDGLGFTTLTHSLDPIATGSLPSGLKATVQGREVTLAWWGSARAVSYNVKRTATRGGLYATIAKVSADGTSSFVDANLTPGKTYYYVVSANKSNGESANSEPVEATATENITLQAEFATFADKARMARNHPGFHGTGFIELSENGYVEFKEVDGGPGGPTALDIRYAASAGARTVTVLVNGVPQKTSATETRTWEDYSTLKVHVKLNRGRNNIIRLQSDGGLLHVDEITTTPGLLGATSPQA